MESHLIKLYALIQLFIPSPSRGDDESEGSMDVDSRRAVIWLLEVDKSNLLLWMDARMFLSISFILHVSDIKLHSFGPLAKRRDTYFVRMSALYEDEGNYSLSSIQSAYFLTFGNKAIVSYTERMFWGLQAAAAWNDKLLSNSAKK